QPLCARRRQVRTGTLQGRREDGAPAGDQEGRARGPSVQPDRQGAGAEEGRQGQVEAALGSEGERLEKGGLLDRRPERGAGRGQTGVAVGSCPHVPEARAEEIEPRPRPQPSARALTLSRPASASPAPLSASSTAASRRAAVI